MRCPDCGWLHYLELPCPEREAVPVWDDGDGLVFGCPDCGKPMEQCECNDGGEE